MKYRICEVCVMDTTDPDIVFMGKRGCSNCYYARKLYLKTKKDSVNIKALANKIRQTGKKQKHDCVIGLSGGVDSSYVAYVVKKLKLRPLAVHVDNGWDSEQAVQNMKNITEKLGIDLYNYVIDWDEFRDVQMAFLKASTPDCEIPTDYAVTATLYNVAWKNHIKYIINGWNVETETVLPRKWSHGHEDWKYVKSVHQRYGEKKLKTFPRYGRLKKIFYNKIARIEKISILNYVPYNKASVKMKLINEFGWKEYGEKHDESFYTKFYQNYILPEKFGYDKRRMHLSSMIVSGQISRSAALKELEKSLYSEENALKDRKLFCKKMGITEDEFMEILKKPKHSYWDYPNYENDIISKIINFVKGVGG